MADIILKNTEGTQITTISNNTLNNVFDTMFIGENVEDYMGAINTNFIKLLENFAGNLAPTQSTTTSGAVEGQLWYDDLNNLIKYRSSGGWESNTTALEGKTLDQLREYILAGFDSSGKLSKSGGSISGSVSVNGAAEVQLLMEPLDSSDKASIGSQNNRFRNIYLAEDGIRLGTENAGMTFKPHNFVYAVNSDSADVSSFPVGAIILHQQTGEAIIKKISGTFTTSNATFRKLADDRQNSALLGGNMFRFLGSKGLFAGGSNTSNSACTSSIEQITIPNLGNSSQFGSLSYARAHLGASLSSGYRSVFQGGWNGSNGNHNAAMDYNIFATPGNSTSFGSFTHENYGASCVSDGSRGIIGPGYNSTNTGNTGHHYTSRYLTIDTPGTAQLFGSIKQGYGGAAVSSGTRGVFSGYSREGWNYKTEYITIQTPGNSLEFGTATAYGNQNAASDTSRGIFFGGTGAQNRIDYITLSTPSNGIYFGRCSTSESGAAVSDGIYGVSAYLYSSDPYNNMSEYVSIQTLGNSSNFGTMATKRKERPGSASGN